jgi:cell division protein FtsI (penicillin-binding protein 3)
MSIPTSENRKRLVWVALFIFSLFCLLIIQFFKIQIIEGEKWTRQAQAQHHLVVTESFKRGLFYSNTAIKVGHPDTHQPFVIDVPKFHLYVDPESVHEGLRGEIAAKLTHFLQLPKKDGDKLRAQFDKKCRSRKLVMWISPEMQAKIQQWWLPFAKSHKMAQNALFFVQDYKRSYPHGHLLGQVLHTVREERDAKTHQSIPTGGLEFVFDRYLQGKEGKRVVLRSPRHPLDSGRILSHPEDGADVHLTINHYLQAIAEEEIAKAVQKAGAKGGWAILMDPRTGEILALAQYPWFEPAQYRKFFNNPQLLEHTKVKALTDPYEPGSTMKPLTMAICLKANVELLKQGKKPLFDPREKIETAPCFLPGRSKVMKDLSYHSYLNMNLALQKSSNVYPAKMVYRIIEQLGAEWYRKALQDIFGFGIKTGIELPSETSGLLPTPGKKHPNGTLEWSGGTPYTLSIGHNILVNSIQMLRSWAVLANGGYLVEPTLVRKIVKTKRDGSVEVLLDNTHPDRVKSFARVLEPEIVEEVVKATKAVTKPGGTSFRADIFGYTEVGKTGTSEKIVAGVYSKKDHITTFMGFAPAKNARFVLCIAIDEPEFRYIPGVGRNQLGGVCAAPAFREIGTRTLQYLGVEPDDPHGYPACDPRYDAAKADWVPEVQALKDLYQKWNGRK